MKSYKDYISEMSGSDTYSRKTKKNIKELNAVVKPTKAEPGYNAEWIYFDDYAVYTHEKLDLHKVLPDGRKGSKIDTFRDTKALMQYIKSV